MTDQPEALDLYSMDNFAAKCQRLLKLFPEARTKDGKIDFERLKLALGEAVLVGAQYGSINLLNITDSFRETQPSTTGVLTINVLFSIIDPREDIILNRKIIDTKSNTNLIPKIAMGKSVDIKLTCFTPSLSTVLPEELDMLKEKGIRAGFDFIDFWAVDFDYYPGKPFVFTWRAFSRGRKRTLQTVSNRHFQYEHDGKHIICVKVVDIFGWDTSVITEVES